MRWSNYSHKIQFTTAILMTFNLVSVYLSMFSTKINDQGKLELDFVLYYHED